MPPPTLAKRATELAPKPKPFMVFGSFKSRNRKLTPSRPKPTTEKPITAPPEKAISKALLMLFFAACAVFTLDLVAAFMPINPATPEAMAPTT